MNNQIFSIILGSDKASVRLHNNPLSHRHRWNSPRHCNAEYELHIILDGVCNIAVAEEEVTLSPMNALIIAPGQYHYPKVLTEPFEKITLSFVLSDSVLVTELGKRVETYATFAVGEKTARTCGDIYEELESGDRFSNDILGAYITSIMVDVFRCVELPGEDTKNRHTTHEEDRLSVIDDFFSGDFKDIGTEDDLASRLHLSKRQLARVLERHYGMGFRQKLISARMDRASWLLRTSKMRIGDIAGHVGYASEAAFYQAFRDFFGITPQKYRKKFM